MPLIDNLVSHWSLEEASGARADDHGSNTLSPVTADPGRATAKVGFGTLFTGGDDGTRFTAASNSSLQMGDIDMTIFGWCGIVVATATTNHGLFGKVGATDGEYMIDRRISTQSLQFSVWGGAGRTNGASVTSGTALTNDNVLFFFVAWHDAIANTINIQVNNGTVDSASHTHGIYVGTDTLKMAIDSVAFRQEWDGLVDQVGIFKRVLTAAERTWLYNANAGRSYAEIVAGMGSSLPSAPVLGMVPSRRPGAPRGYQ